MENYDLRSTKELEVHYPSDDATTNSGSPEIIRKYESTPASNMRTSKKHKLLSAADISGSFTTAKYSVSRLYLLQFLADFAGFVLDNEKGELLEYHHLNKHLKYQKDWGYYFGNEIRRLAQGMIFRNTGTDTIFFIHKS